MRILTDNLLPRSRNMLRISLTFFIISFVINKYQNMLPEIQANFNTNQLLSKN